MMMSEARAEKALTPEEVKADAAYVAQQVRLADIAEWLRKNPEIGTLNRDGGLVFYVYPAHGEYREIAAFEMI